MTTMKNIKMLINFNLRLIYFNLEISYSHAICNFDVQCDDFSKIDNTWWWPSVAKTCSEEEGWLDNKLHLRRKYMGTEDKLMQQDA
jgi:hypothetical protein